jgi:hypothetical protein
LKSIPIRDLFHIIALDTAGPLPKTKAGNKYILVAIDHYSKWCEAKAVANHNAKTASRFLEDNIICRYGVPKFVLTDNGGEWAAEFEASTRFSPFMILTGRTPRLRADNYLHALTAETDAGADVEVAAT